MLIASPEAATRSSLRRSRAEHGLNTRVTIASRYALCSDGTCRPAAPRPR